MPRGLYRDGDFAQVDYETEAIPIRRKLYEERGYQPPFEALPTKEEFQRARRG